MSPPVRILRIAWVGLLTDWLTDLLGSDVNTLRNYMSYRKWKNKVVVFVNKCKYWYTYLRYNIICLSNTYICCDQSGVLSQIIFTLKFFRIHMGIYGDTSSICEINENSKANKIEWFSIIRHQHIFSVCAIKQKNKFFPAHLLVNSQ